MTSTSSGLPSRLIWVLVAIIGAFAFGYIALNRGETINAMWILTAAVVSVWCLLLLDVLPHDRNRRRPWRRW